MCCRRSGPKASLSTSRALQNGRIAGAAQDVLESEPKAPQTLMQSDNVVLLQHMASATRGTRQAMVDRVADNLHPTLSVAIAIAGHGLLRLSKVI